jgi:hypothetical protein
MTHSWTLDNLQSDGFVERILFDFDVQDVEVQASLLIVIDQEALGDMELGPLLWNENILRCGVLSVVNSIQISGLDITLCRLS